MIRETNAEIDTQDVKPKRTFGDNYSHYQRVHEHVHARHIKY